MTVWNVKVAVVELAQAETAEEAIRQVCSRLARNGWEVYPEGQDAFESEPLDDETMRSVLR